MASRELVYRISIDTATAKRGAANVRATFEKELRQISLGNISTSGATGQVNGLAAAFGNVTTAAKSAQEAASGNFLDSSIEGAIGQLKGLAAGYLGFQGVVAAIDLSKLGTQANRTYAALNILSGGGKQAEAVLKAIQKASNGTVTEMEAAGIATQGFALKLARTPAEFEKITRAAREITQISPIINDVGEALTQLSLFASNEASFARADQLGLSVSEVKDRMAELRRENDSLTGSQAKLLASIQLLDEKYGATLNTVEAQASGIEQLRVAWENLKVTIATTNFGVASEFFSIDQAAAALAKTIGAATGDYTRAQFAIDRLGESLVKMGRSQDKWIMMPWDTVSTDADIDNAKTALESYKKALTEVESAVGANAPGAQAYQQQLQNLTVAIGDNATITQEQQQALEQIHAWYQNTATSVVKLADAEKMRAENKISANQFEQSRQGAIYEQQPLIDQALASAAAKVAPIAGIEAAIATYRQQKALVDQAIQQLIDSGVADQGEIAIRVADIVEQLTAPFDALEERAATIDIGNFDQVGTALSNLNAGFTDFLPGVAAAREELVALSTELALTGQLSAEQAAQLEYLSAVAYSVADGGSQLNAVVNELGGSFLESNAYAAELVNQLFLAEAAFRNGQISAGVYAGVTAALTGNLLTLAQGAGIATNAIYALNQAQADMGNLPGFSGGLSIGGSIANRVQTQQAASGREQNRREMERYNRDLERAQTRSATKAGKILEDGAKKASQELKSALDKVPGLFSPTQVTEQDMKDAKLGIYTDKADEKLRRLRDEVLNGVDWADVSIEDAKTSIERLGIKVADTKEGVLRQLEELWSNQALWADTANIDQWIDKGVVQQQLDLQKKSEEGRNNIYKYFGVQVDDAISAATGGGGGGSAPVAPPKLIDIDPLTEGLQTGLDEYVNANGAMIKEQVASAKKLFFDPATLFGTGSATSAATGAKGGFIGPMPKEITITADASAQAFTSFLSAGSASGATTTALQAEITPTLPDDAAQQLALALGDQLSKQTDVFLSHGSNIGKTLLSGMSSVLGVGAKGEISIDIAGLIAGNLSGQTATLEAQGAGIAFFLRQGITSAMADTGDVDAITPLVTSLNTQIRAAQPDIAREGGTIVAMLTGGIGAALATATTLDISTPLVTAIAANVATNIPQYSAQGMVVAQIIMAGILAHMQGGQQAGASGGGGEGGGAPMATALLTNLSTQFSTTQNMFYAVGFLPAQSVESGFKGYGYTGLADSFMEKLTGEIRAQGAGLQQRGGTMASYVQSGFVGAFNSEAFKAQLISIGELMYTYLEIGILAKVNGGALTNAIAEKVVSDIASEMEQP